MAPGAAPLAKLADIGTDPGAGNAAVRSAASLLASASAPAGSRRPKPPDGLYPPAGRSMADPAMARATSDGGRCGWADSMSAAVAVSQAPAAKKLYTG